MYVLSTCLWPVSLDSSLQILFHAAVFSVLKTDGNRWVPSLENKLDVEAIPSVNYLKLLWFCGPYEALHYPVAVMDGRATFPAVFYQSLSQWTG